ncbi:hypothetical protein RP20_CCG001302 [Aedes albopictus]|nr:hypothetical protein RP20_CCG001302 [Aedes albopictus]
MNQRECFLILCFLCSIQFSDTSYQCGIRLHGLRPLIKDGWQVEEGQWPWHVAVFNRLKSTDQFKYGCGGTLINEKHTLTAAHCVKRKRPPFFYEIELHFGQHNLSKLSDNVVVRDVSEIHVHPEYEPNKNDIAVLVMRLPVEYSDTVIPICLDQRMDLALQELEGWVTGWGMTENGTISDVLRTVSLSVVSHLTCLQDDPNLFSNCLNEKVFCAGNKKGGSPGPGDSGGGMYISDGDRWQLRGIISFGKFNELKKSVDASKYIVFVNIQWYLSWVKEILGESELRLDKRQKRISELECERFQTLTRKRPNGDCLNIYMHNVMVIATHYSSKNWCNGVLVDESHVITTCSCLRNAVYAKYLSAKVPFDSYGEVAVSEMACHPKHADDSLRYDLAILKLNETILLSNTLIPACLANNWTENLNDILVQTFYTTQSFDDQMSLVELNENRISLYENCHLLRRPDWFNRSDLIGELCVKSTYKLRYNDYVELSYNSHGAVLQTTDRRSCMSTVVGLKVQNRGSGEYPNRYWMEIYARITYNLDWIEQSIWDGQSKGK